MNDIKKLYSKREWLILKIIASIALCYIGFLIIIHTFYPLTLKDIATRDKTIELRSIIESVASQMSADKPWQDNSNCSYDSVRSFGDTTQYYCSIIYERDWIVKNQSEFNQITTRTYSQLQIQKYVQSVDQLATFNSKLNSDSNITRFTLDKTFSHKQNCYFNYTFDQKNSKMKESIGCEIETAGAYFSAVKEE